MNEIQKYAAGQLVKSSDSNLTTSQAVGGTMVKAGVGAAAVWGAAALIPFVSFFPLMIVVLVMGGYLRLKD